MTAGAMSDGSPVSPELDARLLADLREWRARLAPTSLEGNSWSARLTIDELDMLLRVAAERDALKAAAVAEWEADIPAEIRARAAALPAGHALVDGVVVPLPAEPRPAGSTALGIPYERPRLRDVVADALGEGACSCYESVPKQVERIALAIEREIAAGGIS